MNFRTPRVRTEAGSRGRVAVWVMPPRCGFGSLATSASQRMPPTVPAQLETLIERVSGAGRMRGTASRPESR